jgi:hypothetical protein
LKRANQRAQAFIFEPTRAAYCYIGARWKGEYDRDFAPRRQPFANICPNEHNVPLTDLARRMLKINAVAHKPSIGPWLDDVRRVVAQADYDSIASAGHLNSEQPSRERLSEQQTCSTRSNEATCVHHGRDFAFVSVFRRRREKFFDWVRLDRHEVILRV